MRLMQQFDSLEIRPTEAREAALMAALPAQWAKEHPNFTFIPVLSDPRPEDNWQGRTGLVHQAILDDFESLGGYQVYACGAPIMIEAGQSAFAARDLPEDEFFADSFTYATTP